MENIFLKKIQKHEPCLGTFAYLTAGEAVEALSYTGLDFLIIDAEHGTVESETAANMIRAAKLHDLTPFVRVKDSSRPAVLKMLEAGAHGLVIPQIRTMEEVQNVVAYAKYFPIGSRGVAVGVNGGYGYESFADHGLQDYFDVCNRETLIFPQCETRECLNNIESIASVEGIDGIFIGPYDLSVALGNPGVFDSVEFQSAIERIHTAVRAAGKMTIMYTMKPDEVAGFFHRGFQAVTLSTDIKLMISQIRDVVETIHKEQ